MIGAVVFYLRVIIISIVIEVSRESVVDPDGSSFSCCTAYAAQLVTRRSRRGNHKGYRERVSERLDTRAPRR